MITKENMLDPINYRRQEDHNVTVSVTNHVNQIIQKLHANRALMQISRDGNKNASFFQRCARCVYRFTLPRVNKDRIKQP